MAIALGLLLSTGSAWAGSWLLTPRASTGVQYEDNPRVRVNEDLVDEATGLILDGQLTGIYQTERTQFYLVPRARVSFYAEDDDEDLEDEDWWLRSTVRHVRQKSELGGSLLYSEVGVRTSEFESPDPDDPSAPGSGRTGFADDTQTRWSVDPFYNFQLTPLMTLRLNASYSEVEYDVTGRASGRFDYDYWNGSAALERALGTRTAVGVTIDASSFESRFAGIEGFSLDNVTNTSDTYGGGLYLNYAWSDTVTASLRGGIRQTDIEVERVPALYCTEFDIFGNCIPSSTIPADGVTDPDPDWLPLCFTFVLDPSDPDGGTVIPSILPLPCLAEGDDTNFVGEARIEKRSERNTYTLTVARAITPNSNGAETLRDTFNAGFRRSFANDRLILDLSLLYVDQQDVANLTRRDREYYAGRLGLNWRWTREWSVQTWYRYTKNRDTGFGGLGRGESENNSVFLGVQYQGLGWRWQ